MRTFLAIAALLLLATPAPTMGTDTPRIICDGVNNRPGNIYRIVLPESVTFVKLFENGYVYAVLDETLMPVRAEQQRVYVFHGYVGTRQTEEIRKFGKVIE
jgi:hypothetical protein